MDDKMLRKLILEELDWDPSFDSADIGVQVADGVVTLTGHVRSYQEKLAVERAVARVKGVRAIAAEVVIRVVSFKKTSDDEIAKRALDILAWSAAVPEERLQVKVQAGYVTLSGDVDWQFQKEAAEEAVKRLGGVMGVANNITLHVRPSSGNIKGRIEEALRRSAATEAQGIRVTVADGKVTLEGKVRAYYERDVIERAVWAAAGVKEVVDHVTVTG
jgi:osmotically-inducible protein OsmY